MKKTIIILISLLLVLTLGACGGDASESNTTAGDIESVSENLETPIETQLMLGTVKLDETEHAIDSQHGRPG